MEDGAWHAALAGGQLWLFRGVSNIHSMDKPAGLTWQNCFFKLPTLMSGVHLSQERPKWGGIENRTSRIQGQGQRSEDNELVGNNCLNCFVAKRTELDSVKQRGGVRPAKTDTLRAQHKSSQLTGLCGVKWWLSPV